MKKKLIGFRILWKFLYSSKIWKIMRLSGLLIVLCTFHLLADNSYSQNARLSIDLQQVTIDQVLSEIENKSEFYFLYNNKLIDVTRIVNIKAENQPIKNILDGLFASSNVDYIVIDRQIVLSPGEYLSEAKFKLQPRTITGTVVDENGETLPGVAVMVKGTTRGTMTDMEGKFSIEVEDRSAVLVFSFVGYATQEIAVENRTTLNVTMAIDMQELEVLVTGYATQKKASLTGSVASVGTEELVEIPTTNIAQRLQGRISGVSIINSRVPGGGAQVRVRGLSTINNNDPLYVIDGVPIKENLSILNPNDITSVTVLKDAASAAIYGASGANGVIIITTLQGKAGEPRISVDAKTGISRITKTYDLLNTQEYGELLWLEAANDGVPPGNQIYGYGDSPSIPDYILPARAVEGSPEVDPALYNYDPNNLYLIMKANKEGTDWFDEILRPALLQEYNFSITGGSNTGGYALSAGYLHEEGVLIKTGFKRYSIRANSYSKLKERFEVGESLGLIFSEGYGNLSNNNENASIFAAVRVQPIIPVYDIMGNYGGTKAPSTSGGENPVAVLTRDANDYNRHLRGIGNVYAQANIIKGLNYKTLFGFDLLYGVSKDIFIKNLESSMTTSIDALNEGSNNTTQWNWQNLLLYNRTFENIHNLNVLLGTEAVNKTYRYINAGRNSFFSTNPNYMFLSAGESNQSNSGLGWDEANVSYFGKLNYDYDGRYLLEATFRRDGSSRFGGNNRWGNFPAFSVGWRISRESFMDNLYWIGDLKLRAAWGKTGNSEIGRYNGFTTFRTNPRYSYYGLDGSNTSATAGFDSGAFGNPDAKWETTTTTDLGFDATLFNGSFLLTFDWWNRNTSDMLFVIPRPDVIGQATFPSVNIGEMKNIGFDLEATYRNDAFGGKLNYDIKANVYHYKNEIVKLSGEEKVFHGGVSLRNIMYTAYNVGTAFPEFYGYIVEGIFQTQEEADAWPKAFGADGTYNQPGHFKYKDVNGDNVIDNEDRTWIGSPHPDFIAGLTADLKYKNWDMSTFFYLSYGNEIISYVRRWIDYTIFQGNRSKDRLYKSWGSPYLDDNRNSKLAKAEVLNDEGNQQASTHFVEDGSFLRLKNLQIGYNLPGSVLQKSGMNNLRIYLQVTNLFTITKFSGLDPEIDPGSQISMGVDQGAWPTPRQFIVGVNVGL